jgi:hypothetical protein
VPNWSISRNYKENWNSTKISVTPGIHLTQRGSVQRPLTSGPRGWPGAQTLWPVGPTLQLLVGWLHGNALQEVVTMTLKLEVSGGRTQWPFSHVARPAAQHLAVTHPWTPINTPLPVEFKIPHSTCKGSGLVVVA